MGGPEAGPLSPFPVPPWLRDADPGSIPGLVDPEGLLSLTTQSIVQRVQEARDESKRYRAPFEPEWQTYADLYMNRHSWEDAEKESWQSDLFIPKIFTKVELSKSLVKGALLDAPKWFTLEEVPSWRTDSRQVKLIEDVVRLELEKAKFIREFMKGFEEGSLFGSGCICVGWDNWVERGPQLTEEPLFSDPMQAQMMQMMGQPLYRPVIRALARLRNALSIRQVPLWACYPDPFAGVLEDCKYFVEESAVDHEDLSEGVAAGIYDSIDDLGSPVPFDLEAGLGTRDSNLNNLPSSSRRKRHLIQTYYGNFYSKAGDLVLENWKAIVANKKTLLALGPNPLFTGKLPYIWITPIQVRGCIWGRSMVQAAAPMAVARNELTNLMMDGFSFATLPAAVLDPNKLDDPAEIESIAPGSLFYGREGAVTPIKISSAPNDVWPALQSLDNEIDEATGLNEFMEGTPTAKGRPTAFEVRSKTQAGQAQKSGLARDIEDNCLVAAVERAYEFSLQMLSDTSDPDLQQVIEAFGGPMDFSDPYVRYAMLSADFKVKARGISFMLSRDEQIGKNMQLMQLGQQLGIPLANGPLQLYYRTAELMGTDPREIGQPQTPEEFQQMMFAMQAQQMAGASAGGGSDATRSGPPEPPTMPPTAPQPNSPQAVLNQVQAPGPPAMMGM